MDGLEYHLVPELDLAILRIARASKIMDIGRFLAAKDAEGRTRFLIVHIKEGIVGTYSLEELKNLLVSRRKAVAGRRNSHTIFVLDAEIDATLLRWFKAYAENALQWPVRYHLAPNVDDAVKLVRELRNGGRH